MEMALSLPTNNLDRYMAAVNKYPVLSREQEMDLARRYYDESNVDAAHKLVVSNLRFVVKVAQEFKGYGLKLLDLIQEGNIGLMMAVKRFDPYKGYRLISYAVWWIRAYMKSFIARSWSMVRMGSSRAQKKLFFKVRSARNKMEQQQANGERVSNEALAEELGVEPADIESMEHRLAARDFQLDSSLVDGGRTTHLDRLTEDDPMSPEQAVGDMERHSALRGKVSETMEYLDEREKYIVEHRLLSDEPETLQEIGDRFKVTRERARQIETKVIKKLRAAFQDDPDAGVAMAS